MRNLVAERIALPLVMFALWSVTLPAAAQKIIDLGTDTLRIEGRTHGKYEVSISTDGDTATRVVIQGREYSRKDDEASVVRTGEDITIGPGEEVDGDVVSIGGNVTVFGQVRGDAVAIGGDVRLKDGSVVRGSAVSIGGRVDREPDAVLHGQDVGMNFVPGKILNLRHAQSGFSFVGFTALIVLGIMIFLFGWLLHALADTRMRGVGDFLIQSPWKSLAAGLAIVLLAPAAFLLLLVTVIGIPIALVLFVLLPVAHAVGLVLVATATGGRLWSRPGSAVTWNWTRSLGAGLALFFGIILFGAIFRSIGGVMGAFGWALIFFGWTVVFLAATVGLGSLVLSRFGGPGRPVEAGPPIPPPPPSGAMPPFGGV